MAFRLIRSGRLPGARNMALDAALRGDDAPPRPTVRLYGWAPWTLSLGRFQRVGPADLEPFDRAGFDVTRRETGGGAILHGDEITYSVALPGDDPRIPRDRAASYDWLHGAVVAALAGAGVAAAPRGGREGDAGPDGFFCFARTASIDLVCGGRKICGSAQRRTATAFLQHGSLPLSPNGTAPGATSLFEASGGRPPDVPALLDALARGFEGVLGERAEEGAPTAAEEARAAGLERERFGDRERVLDGGRGRATEPPPALPAGPEPLLALRAAVEGDALRVLASGGGDHPALPHARLRAADAARLPRVARRALALARDPWDSTFRRSHFAAAREGADPEGERALRSETIEEDVVLLLLYGAPPAALRLDARRFDFRDLGPERSGDPARDAAALLRALAARAPGAALGPGARRLLAGRPPDRLPGAPALLLRAAACPPLKS